MEFCSFLLKKYSSINANFADDTDDGRRWLFASMIHETII